MHIFLYEWVTGGGLVEDAGHLPASMLAEGSAMISAVSADFAELDGCTVTVFRDARITDLPLRDCEVIDIHSAPQRRREFERLAAAADWSLAVAPEFDAILRTTVAAIREAGGKSLNASDEFIALASNKHLTAERLRSAGVPAPAGRILDADEEKLPSDFRYPGVLKPLDGAGSQHILLVSGPLDEPPPYPWPRRLEQFYPGRAASVAAVCGECGTYLLPPCWQELSSDSRFTYRGGSDIEEDKLQERAAGLALRALSALPPARGYVGVDLVLGDAADGRDDAVIEINPRLTTSYVGLRAIVEQNLALQILKAVQGEQVHITRRDGRVEFAASGTVRTQRA